MDWRGEWTGQYDRGHMSNRRHSSERVYQIMRGFARTLNGWSPKNQIKYDVLPWRRTVNGSIAGTLRYVPSWTATDLPISPETLCMKYSACLAGSQRLAKAVLAADILSN